MHKKKKPDGDRNPLGLSQFGRVGYATISKAGRARQPRAAKHAPFDGGKAQSAAEPELTPEQPAALANEESKTLRREAATRLFAEDWWPLRRMLRWIAFRDPA